MWSEDGTPWVTIGDMTRGPVVTDTDRKVSLAGLAAKRLPLGATGTLLFAMYASLGEVAFLGTEASWNQAILGIRPRPQASDIRFVKYCLESLRACANRVE